MPLRTDYVDPFRGIENDPVLHVHEHGRKRGKVLTEAGKELGLTDTDFSQDMDVFQGNHLCVPGPSKEVRWGGICRFLPMLWADVVRWQVTTTTEARAYCLSCQRSLQPRIEVLPMLPGMRRRWIRLPSVSRLVALARASDHDREFMNHQIVVLDHQSGDVIARNGYKPFSTSWA